VYLCRKKTKFMAIGTIAAIGLASSALPTLAKAGTGIFQAIEGKRAVEELEGQEPDIYTPSAFRQRVIEPVAESQIASLEEGAQRRTGQSVGALQSGGSRTLLGGLSSVLDDERQFARKTQAMVDQERKRALGELARADMNTQQRRQQVYQQKMAAAQNLRNAGLSNVVGATESIGQVGQQLAMGDLMGYFDQGGTGSSMTFGDIAPAPQVDVVPKGMNK
jgi:hypothetical protein